MTAWLSTLDLPVQGLRAVVALRSIRDAMRETQRGEMFLLASNCV